MTVQEFCDHCAIATHQTRNALHILNSKKFKSKYDLIEYRTIRPVFTSVINENVISIDNVKYYEV